MATQKATKTTKPKTKKSVPKELNLHDMAVVTAGRKGKLHTLSDEESEALDEVAKGRGLSRSRVVGQLALEERRRLRKRQKEDGDANP